MNMYIHQLEIKYMFICMMLEKRSHPFCYTPRNEVRGGILESPCPSVCRRARLGKIARLGIGCRGGYFVPLGQPHSSFGTACNLVHIVYTKSHM